MAAPDIAARRLAQQQLAQQTFERPEQVVAWFGAVQAQEYAGAKWAVAQRAQGLTDAALDQALADGAILRTHLMRPTWHFVAPADIRWLLALTAPRVRIASAYAYRTLALDDAIFARSNAALERALQGGKQLTRAELVPVLQQAGIATDDIRATNLMMRAELDGVICSGGRRGKQFTYALLEERVPQTQPLAHDHALAELAKRYFTSHGPATLKDYVWWSGLTVTDAKAGLEMVKSQLTNAVIDDQTYWFADSIPIAKAIAPIAYLLPNYDEYIVGYTDRSAVYDEQHTSKLDSRGNVLFNNIIVIDGKVAGIWKRTLKKDTVVITAQPFTTFNTAENAAFAIAAQRYGAFLGMQVMLQTQ